MLVRCNFGTESHHGHASIKALSPRSTTPTSALFGHDGRHTLGTIANTAQLRIDDIRRLTDIHPSPYIIELGYQSRPLVRITVTLEDETSCETVLFASVSLLIVPAGVSLTHFRDIGVSWMVQFA